LYGIQAKSELSQNFLFEPSISDKIVRSVNPDNSTSALSNALIIEVGAGPGLLTRSILKAHPGYFIAIEKDRRFLPMLNQLANISPCPMHIIHGDALNIQLKDLIAHPSTSSSSVPASPISLTLEKTQIIGNLPFNIATPLFFKYLHECNAQMGMTLMFQKEVAERMLAKPSTPQRSRLSVVVQAMCDPMLVCNVPHRHFIPRPKVDAAVVKFQPLSNRYPYLSHLEKFLSAGFMHPRKTIENNLKKKFSMDTVHSWFNQVHIDPKQRPEDLSTKTWLELANLAHSTCSST
ncbi:Dimethyladenosine transferase 1, mitochondrial, partial [Coelomomyces lativittatus]